MKALLPRPPKAENSEEKGEKLIAMAIVLVTTTKTTNLKRLYYYTKRFRIIIRKGGARYGMVA